MMPIFFDTDLGSDVDDAFALTFLIKHKAPLIAVQTVSGPVRERAHACLELLDTLGVRNIPVFAGSPHPLNKNNKTWMTGFEKKLTKNNANIMKGSVDKILKKQHEFVTLATGPLTNIAKLTRKRWFLKQCKQIVVMGGVLNNTLNVSSEHNFEQDIEAVKEVFTSTIPITCIPLNITIKHSFTLLDLPNFIDSKNPTNLLLKKWSNLWLNYTKTFSKNSPFREKLFWHDPIAALFCLEPDLFTLKNEHISLLKTGEMMKSKNGKFTIKLCSTIKKKGISTLIQTCKA